VLNTSWPLGVCIQTWLSSSNDIGDGEDVLIIFTDPLYSAWPTVEQGSYDLVAVSGRRMEPVQIVFLNAGRSSFSVVQLNPGSMP
jgi:hypothetical protein